MWHLLSFHELNDVINRSVKNSSTAEDHILGNRFILPHPGNRILGESSCFPEFLPGHLVVGQGLPQQSVGITFHQLHHSSHFITFSPASQADLAKKFRSVQPLSSAVQPLSSRYPAAVHAGFLGFQTPAVPLSTRQP